jgi:hypothetical protein
MSYIDLDLIEPGRSVSGSVQAISVAASLASVGKGLAVNCGVESIAVSGLDALANSPRIVDALAASILSESQVSSVLTEVLDSFVDLDIIVPVPLVVDAATESVSISASVAAVSTSRTVSSGVEAISVGANAAGVSAGRLVNALAGSISVQANTASLAAARTVDCAVEAVTVTASAATIGAGLSVNTSAASVLSESLVSAVLTEVLDSFVDLDFPDPIPLVVDAATESIAVQANAASLDTVRNVDCALELVGVTAAQATIGAGLSVAASPASVLSESLVSSVLTEVLDSFVDLDLAPPDSRTVDASLATIGVTGLVASVQMLRLVESSTEAVGVASGAASVSKGRAPTLSVVGVSVDAEQAGVVLSRTVDTGTESVSVTSLGAELGIVRNVDGSTASATVIAFPASIPKEVGASAAQIVVDAQVATVSTVEAGIPAGRAVVSLEAYRADVIYGNTPPAPRRVKPQPRRRVARIAARRVSRR